jgi:hypothetical protein
MQIAIVAGNWALSYKVTPLPLSLWTCIKTNMLNMGFLQLLNLGFLQLVLDIFNPFVRCLWWAQKGNLTSVLRSYM